MVALILNTGLEANFWQGQPAGPKTYAHMSVTTTAAWMRRWIKRGELVNSQQVWSTHPHDDGTLMSAK